MNTHAIDAGMRDERGADVAIGGHDVEHAGREPAASAASASTNTSSGVSGAGLNTIGQPAASTGAIFAAADMSGPLNGTIAPTTPIGSRTTSAGAIAPWRTSRNGKVRVRLVK